MRKRLEQWLRTIKDERGSGTVFMILMLPAFLALAGLAIDAASAYRTRAVLQSAADAASLAAALALPDVDKAKADAIMFANANVPPGYGTNVLTAADVVPGTWDGSTQTFTPNTANPNSVQIVTHRDTTNGNALPTTFLQLVGIDQWNVSAQSIATMSVPSLRVSLVLDNTGSMNDADKTGYTKIAALKDASHKLLGILESATVNPGDVQVAIVPFTRDVNIGTGYAGASWLGWSNWSAAPSGSTPGTGVGPGSKCPWSTTSNGLYCQTDGTNGSSEYMEWQGSGRSQTYVNAVPPSGLICPSQSSTGQYYNGCYNSVATAWDKKGNPTKWSHTWVPNNTSTWDGCVTDRNQDYDTTNTTPDPATPATLMVADNSPYCPSATIMAESYDWTALNNKIDSMVPNGSTNQTIGLAWGWQALTEGDPLDPAPPPANTGKVIILLSDGLNTQDRWYGDGLHQNSNVDTRMEKACANAKAAGIIVYTVYVDISGAQGNSQVLQDCASTPSSSYYFDLTSSADISDAFQIIAKRIIAMRLVH